MLTKETTKRQNVTIVKKQNVGLPYDEKNYDDMLSRFYTIPASYSVLTRNKNDWGRPRVYVGCINWISRCQQLFTCVSYAEARLSYRLSVCPSVTRWYCIKTAEHIVLLSSPHDSPFILVLCISRSSRNLEGVTPCGAAKQMWGMKMLQFSTSNLLHLRNAWSLDRWVYAARRFTSIESSFQPCEFTAIVPGAYPGEAKMCKNVLKCRNFWNYGLNYWETVEDRWVHAWMRLTKCALDSLDVTKYACTQNGWRQRHSGVTLLRYSQIMCLRLIAETALTHVPLAIAILLVNADINENQTTEFHLWAGPTIGYGTLNSPVTSELVNIAGAIHGDFCRPWALHRHAPGTNASKQTALRTWSHLQQLPSISFSAILGYVIALTIVLLVSAQTDCSYVT